MKMNSKMKMTLEMKMTAKINLPFLLCPTPPPEMLSGVQTGKGILHDRYIIRGIARAHAYRNDYICMKR